MQASFILCLKSLSLTFSAFYKYVALSIFAYKGRMAATTSIISSDLRKVFARRRMFKQDTASISYLYLTWCSICKEYLYIHGICVDKPRRFKAYASRHSVQSFALSRFGYKLGDIFNRGTRCEAQTPCLLFSDNRCHEPTALTFRLVYI